jgi:sulfofructose kinase
MIHVSHPTPDLRDVEVLGLGVAVRDLTVWLDHHPAPDEKLPAQNFVESGGGPVSTALVTLARLGTRCGFLGLVGDDHAGRFVKDEMEREGVNCDGLVLRSGIETPTSVILVVEEHRTICEWRQEIVPLEPEALARIEPAIDRCRYLLVDGRMPDAQIAAARRVRSAGGAVVLDAGHPRPGVDALLPHTDVAILSHTFPAALPGSPEPEAFLSHLVSRMAPDGRRIAGLTLGARGCIIQSGDARSLSLPAHTVEVADTTGAGDVFHAAFVHALLAKDDLESAARFANAAAALKCRGKTGRAPIPGRAQIRHFAGLHMSK